jgi:hypothetical protein
MLARRFSLVVFIFFFVLTVAHAADELGLVMLWPDKDHPTLKISFGRLRDAGSYEGQITIVSEVIVQNLSAAEMPHASLTVSLLDKDHIRIGHGLLVVNDLNPGESAKVLFQSQSVGIPVTISISGTNSGGIPSAKLIPMEVISEPAGATLTIDGKSFGFTPAKISVAVGTHTLELQKEGYALTTTPLDVAADEAPGGSIKVTLGGLSSDVVVLRDGSNLTGDVIAMTIDSITLRVDGKEQKLDRNLVSKMFLVERIVNKPTPAATKTAKQGSLSKSQPQ